MPGNTTRSRRRRAQFAPVNNLGGAGAGVSGQAGGLLDRDALVTHHAHERGPQLLRDPAGAQPGRRGNPAEVPPQVVRLIRRAHGRGEHQAVLLPQLPRPRALPGLAPHLRLQRLNGDLRDPQRPARPDGLGVTVRPDRPPHRDRLGVQVHVVPCQRPRILGPDSWSAGTARCTRAAASPRPPPAAPPPALPSGPATAGPSRPHGVSTGAETLRRTRSLPSAWRRARVRQLCAFCSVGVEWVTAIFAIAVRTAGLAADLLADPLPVGGVAERDHPRHRPEQVLW